MSERPTEEVRKITFLGDTATGKTSLIKQYMFNAFNQNQTATIGVDFYNKTELLEDKKIKIQLWDTAGHERYAFLVPMCLQATALVCIVFDVTNQSSYDSLSLWIASARQKNSRCPIILVANKVDSEKERVVSVEKIKDFALSQNLEVIETSAKMPLNVKALFNKCATVVLQPSCPKSNQTPQQLIDKLRSDNPENEQIGRIAGILQAGLNTDNPQDYFNQSFRVSHPLQDIDTIKLNLDKLAWTNKSLCNTVANVLITIFLGLSVVGLPLAYCFGILEQNQQTHGHSFMFFAFGEKQQAISVCNQVFAEVGVDCRM